MKLIKSQLSLIQFFCDTSHFVLEKDKGQMKGNEPGKQRLGGQNSPQQAKHAKLYSDSFSPQQAKHAKLYSDSPQRDEGQMEWNEPGKQRLGGQNSPQQAKYAKLYSDSLQT